MELLKTFLSSLIVSFYRGKKFTALVVAAVLDM